MRDTEGFVQVQVTDIRPEISWTAQPNLGIHICPIHVNLPTVGMDNSADVLICLEYTVGRGIQPSRRRVHYLLQPSA